MNSFLKHTFIRFAIVGGLGFMVDLASMLLFSLWLPHTIARCIAFWVAASSNWWWNRHITFINTQPATHKKATTQWLQFLASSMVAFIPNWGCYLFLIQQPYPVLNPTIVAIWPYLAMIPGVLVGMMINYIFSRFWVFSQNVESNKNSTQ